MVALPEYELASLGRRFLGYLIDSFLHLAIFVLARKILSSKGMPLIVSGIPLPIVISFIIVLAVQWHFLVKNGQSIGKMVMRTKILTMDNRKPSVVAVIGIRCVFSSLFRFIPLIRIWVMIADYVTIFSENRRCLHDYLAGTKVVDLDKPI